MTAHEMRPYRTQLRNLIARISGDVTRLEAESLRPDGPESSDQPNETLIPEADLPNRKANEDVSLAVLNAEGHILQEAEAALHRIESGVFGQCEECGHAISHARLDAVPYARHCIRCAREAESNEAVKS